MSSRDVPLSFTLLPGFWFRVFTFAGPWPWVSRGSVSLVFALVKGEGYSPAHEGIRRAGAPSTQRPCGSGQVDIRAHPPVEPARDHRGHHTRIHCSVRVSPRRVRRFCSHVKRGDGGWNGRRAAGRIHRAIPKERIECCATWGSAGIATGDPLSSLTPAGAVSAWPRRRGVCSYPRQS